MGLFSGIKKAFKKIVKGIKKVVKGVVKGVKKVVKKIGSSKILKALAIAAAVVVTGGAAIGAFGGKLASTNFGKFMMGASQKLAGGSLFGTKATGFLRGLQKAGNIASKVAFKPFVSVGQAAGNITGAVTDFTGLTSKAGRLGYTDVGGTFTPTTVSATEFKPGTLTPQDRLLADIKAGQDTIHGTGTIVDAAGNVSKIPSGQVYDTMAKGQTDPEKFKQVRDMTDDEIQAAGYDPSTHTVTEQGELLNQATGEVVQPQKSMLSKAGSFALGAASRTGEQLLYGYARSELLGQDEGGVRTGLANESKEYQDALQVYAASEGINLGDIYKQLSFGTADPSYQVNSELYTQQAFQPVYT